MAKKGLLIQYDYCTGCMACVVACKQEHGYPEGRFGIMVKDMTRETDGKVQVDFLPFPTDLCDLCSRRVASGGRPACVKHCMTACMSYGELADLAEEMETKPRSVLYAQR